MEKEATLAGEVSSDKKIGTNFGENVLVYLLNDLILPEIGQKILR